MPSSENEIQPDFLRSCLIDAGRLALAERGQGVAEIKADRTPVTAVDRAVEKFLIERIRQRYPGHQVLSEESGLHPGSAEFTWVIDPIDGTRSFASGLPIWGVSIGILRDGTPVAGGLYMPVTDELYWGDRSRAFYNNRQLPRLQPPDLDDVLVFLAVPSNFYLHYDIRFPRARSLGSTAAHLAYAATGAAVGVLLRSANLWDLAGLLPVLSAVGVEMQALSGHPFWPADLLDGGPIREPLLAAHPAVMDALRASIVPRKRA